MDILTRQLVALTALVGSTVQLVLTAPIALTVLVAPVVLAASTVQLVLTAPIAALVLAIALVAPTAQFVITVPIAPKQLSLDRLEVLIHAYCYEPPLRPEAQAWGAHVTENPMACDEVI
jgi:CBS domain containing-hemolysin-like protein